MTQKAEWDLKCNEQVEIIPINKTTYGARGCGKEAAYVLVDCHLMNWASVCKAVLDSTPTETD